MDKIFAGNKVRLNVSFANAAGVAADPGTVRFKLKEPGKEIATFLFGTDAAVIRTDVGDYYYDHIPTVGGLHRYRWEGSTGIEAITEGFVEVEPSPFIGET